MLSFLHWFAAIAVFEIILMAQGRHSSASFAAIGLLGIIRTVQMCLASAPHCCYSPCLLLQPHVCLDTEVDHGPCNYFEVA